MHLLFENWRKFLTEAQVSYAGILKLSPSPATVSELTQLSLPEGAIPLPEEKLHVTLAHQSILKPYGKELKGTIFPEAPEPKLLRDTSGAPSVQEANDGERRSWVVFLENQEEMQKYINEILEMFGAPPNPEPERKFHISVANLTGEPKDSVRYP